MTALRGGRWAEVALRDGEQFDLIECVRESVPFDLEFVAVLKVQPESFAGAEVPGEAHPEPTGLDREEPLRASGLLGIARS
jgi:hypothetical protein